MSKQEVRLPLSYDLTIKEGSFTPEELQEKGLGGAEGIVFGACMREEGKMVAHFFTGKEKKETLSGQELYDVWISLGKKVIQEVAKEPYTDLSEDRISRVMSILILQGEDDAKNERRDTGSDRSTSETSDGGEATGDNLGFGEPHTNAGNGEEISTEARE